MFEESATILSSDTSGADYQPGSGAPNPWRKIILVFLLLLLGGGLVFGGLIVFKKYRQASPGTELKTDPNLNSSNTPNLPNFNQPETATSSVATSTLSNLPIEYLTFADFYAPFESEVLPNFKDYELPLNVKLDVLNYYDVSRKLNLDPGLESLDNNGFALIDNPWPKEGMDFYKIYEQLDEKQIPILLTSDFIIYYYQNVLKKTFKDIEENVFYDNLWNINKDLYAMAKNRYEVHLAAVGNINDSILEGERLAAAYFAVALELLKPAANQIISQGSLDDKSKFLPGEAERFYFSIPPYLRDDVLREVKLIREAKEKSKSPVFLYLRDYRDFSVPADYQENAKLNNFYLTTKWLNSVFPLNYRTADCPNCLLDRADWRVNLVAASLISSDAANLPEIKNKWARIYKIMSFFKGLREDLNYVYYRDSLSTLFGQDYKISELFSDQNPEALANLEKLRLKLLTYNFPSLQGAYDKEDQNDKIRLGFKFLAESYWPNDYIFSRLTTPKVDAYLGKTPTPENVTACTVGSLKRRCNGFALDVINLAVPLGNGSYFEENTNYSNYQTEAESLRRQLNEINPQGSFWRFNNYWTTLSFIKAFLESDKNNWPVFGQSEAWQQRSLNTAVGAWVNLQLPLEKYSTVAIFKGQGFNNIYQGSENSYIEPNLELINELLANNSMLLKMFAVLKLNEEINPASQNLQASSNSLNSLKAVIIKEINGEALAPEDQEAIIDFVKQIQIEPVPSRNREIIIKSGLQKTGLKENLNRFKLLVLLHGSGASKVFSVGPVWDYQEGH